MGLGTAGDSWAQEQSDRRGGHQQGGTVAREVEKTKEVRSENEARGTGLRPQKG